MMKCPFCGHANEEGTLYCEQCKTDLSISAPTTPAAAPEPVVSDFVFEMIEEPSSNVPVLQPTNKLDHIPIVESVPVGEIPHVPTVEPAAPLLELMDAPPIPVVPASPASLETTHAPTVSEPAKVLPLEAKPKLLVIRGEKIDMQYAVYPGKNYIGRTDDKPVDIDLENQEPPDRIWSSRQHAIITFENGVMTIEDLNSLNGTFVNRTRVHPGQPRTLQANDVIQIGTVQMKVVMG